MSPPNLLQIDALTASYDRSPVLRDVSLTVPEGSFIAVVGANTAGKSTLLRCISGLLDKTRGSVKFDGQEILRLAPHRIPELGIAHVPEGRHVFPEMTVEENLYLGGYTRRRDTAEVKRDCDGIYALFPRLRERRRQLAGTLSGGEQQMVAFGRALMLKPRLLLLDEPSHGLAPKVVEEMHQAMVDIHRSGLTILLVEQNTRLALSVAEYAYVLQSGSMVLSGPSNALLEDSRVRAAYLGL
ncbi:LIV-I protein F [Achromobacter denitrificans]|jgi:branched-chain amino acid transport system ATP-binding protein|uniref:ABC transporter ATP-binding protein n=1 Tax=Achromobacter denitrificans TaxID=32002 RepID=UPI0009EBE418|nr:ABC transporter ATP-binding protein [Achromobacter denitrificans]ASC65120.1 branched-chain amino acid ABC transporter ATP-binding protein [Achromobacter denitrificans]QKH43763.1 ABC transporter ATP-binding protein [Achromobacter denitrificans]QKH49096.1 ABC transporter ATP-binding protein [Achromobacter denitrificans]CAB3688427.1 High-affinity branched-chain amino acid transport ATP-binding protein LivF [Achromobacter denitrificans]SUU11010.1 LIV-I protein F [Achromobacter denitrificans]